jgi:hypothetical protein
MSYKGCKKFINDTIQSGLSEIKTIIKKAIGCVSEKDWTRHKVG